MPELVDPRHILRRIDRQRFFLLQVAEAREDMPPICKIVSKKEAFKRAKEQRKAQSMRTNTSSQKRAELQLSWLVTPYDLSHKLKQAKRHLVKRGKGAQVEITIVTRKDRGLASRDAKAKQRLLDSIEAELSGSAGEEDSPDAQGDGSVNFGARRKGDVEWRDHQSKAVVLYEAC